MNSVRVLVTGHRGYIGSVLVSVLRHARFDVVGLDCEYYRDCDFGRTRESVPNFEMDLRDVEFTDLLSFDAVIHLAAVPWDGIAGQAAGEINVDAARRLIECSRQAGVSRFILGSTCEVYGRSSGGSVDEGSTPIPISRAARAALQVERDLAFASGNRMVPVVMRHGVVYGASPRLRLDTLVNGSVASGLMDGCVQLEDDGSGWRPFVHVEDLARAYAAVMLAPDDRIRGETFNMAGPDVDHRTIDVADAVVDRVPHAVRAVGRYQADTPSHRVDGSKFMGAFPGFTYRWNLALGIRQLIEAMRGAGLTPGDSRSDRYRRAARLASLRERGELDPTWRRKLDEPALSLDWTA